MKTGTTSTHDLGTEEYYTLDCPYCDYEIDLADVEDLKVVCDSCGEEFIID